MLVALDNGEIYSDHQIYFIEYENPDEIIEALKDIQSNKLEWSFEFEHWKVLFFAKEYLPVDFTLDDPKEVFDCLFDSEDYKLLSESTRRFLEQFNPNPTY